MLYHKERWTHFKIHINNYMASTSLSVLIGAVYRYGILLCAHKFRTNFYFGTEVRNVIRAPK